MKSENKKRLRTVHSNPIPSIDSSIKSIYKKEPETVYLKNILDFYKEIRKSLPIH